MLKHVILLAAQLILQNFPLYFMMIWTHYFSGGITPEDKRDSHTPSIRNWLQFAAVFLFCQLQPQCNKRISTAIQNGGIMWTIPRILIPQLDIFNYWTIGKFDITRTLNYTAQARLSVKALERMLMSLEASLQAKKPGNQIIQHHDAAIDH